jgi:hypothetical protein
MRAKMEGIFGLIVLVILVVGALWLFSLVNIPHLNTESSPIDIAGIFTAHNAAFAGGGLVCLAIAWALIAGGNNR